MYLCTYVPMYLCTYVPMYLISGPRPIISLHSGLLPEKRKCGLTTVLGSTADRTISQLEHAPVVVRLRPCHAPLRGEVPVHAHSEVDRDARRRRRVRIPLNPETTPLPSPRPSRKGPSQRTFVRSASKTRTRPPRRSPATPAGRRTHRTAPRCAPVAEEAHSGSPDRGPPIAPCCRRRGALKNAASPHPWRTSRPPAVPSARHPSAP